ncbi:MAG: MAE_28990/MAE_18760 family HEPN-like nuclease [Candidatus Delongbacteria bacterium]|jgi:hypothetical protein|nr:MAE_28990/MAE_18760 family HEPN-like nuclease [Candidatus Delongbacteria bacterium]
MASIARKAFDKNLKDIAKLMQLHKKEGGTSRGRRYDLEVLNKSAIVLITSYWEAYCEDIAAEAVEHIVKYAKDADKLPKDLKKGIAKKIKADPHELAVWTLSDKKWKEYLKKNLLNELQDNRNRKLNTPTTENIENLFKSAIGLIDISKSWKWSNKMTINRAKVKLDKYVKLRCEIAHRGKLSKSVTKSEVKDYLKFIKQIAGKTGGKINTYLKQHVGKPLWQIKKVKRII